MTNLNTIYDALGSWQFYQSLEGKVNSKRAGKIFEFEIYKTLTYFEEKNPENYNNSYSPYYR